ncbi:MAG: DUF2330 domain-containing protein, partial [Polyangiaceae bacterium]
MKRSSKVLGFGMMASGIVASFAALTAFGERDAKACGGCFHPPTQTASDITDERMLLSVSPQQTTLYDQIRYSGTPTSFAWVLPIHGTVDVGLSADVLFDSVDAVTTTQIVAPALNCPAPPLACQNRNGAASDAGSSFGAGSAPDNGVTVTKQENVGPYATVQLHSTDPQALNQWLADNGYQIPADVTPIIDQYVSEGFDFLAMKLLPSSGVQAMRPVRVTTQGASLSLPLRMAAVGTGATVGITIWVVSDGRYEPQNFPGFRIEDSELVWDWKQSASNYTTLRAQHEAALGGKGWELESSLELNQALVNNVILSGGVYYGGGYGGGSAPGGYQAPADQDYLGTDGDAGAADDGGVDGGSNGSAEQARTDDIAHLFAGISGPNARITRMRSDISHAAMTTDFVLQASADQSELSNVRQVQNQINEQCPIYDGCDVVGYGSAADAQQSIDNTSSSAGGCVTAARGEADGGLTALLGMLGFVAIRKASDR